MDLQLRRTEKGKNGIFGEWYSASGKFLYLVNLEHAFLQDDGTYEPIVPSGVYKMIRYASPKHGYDVFMFEKVPGHDHVEIHIGNYNHDSDGCSLVGTGLGWADQAATIRMVMDSKTAFKKFMDLNKDEDSWTLTVS